MSFDKKEYQKRYMKQKRLERKGLTPESNSGAEKLESNAGKSNTDEMFEAMRPGYYVFGREEREAICFTCYKKFRTRLELLKFCSPRCQKEKLSTFTTVGAGNEL